MGATQSMPHAPEQGASRPYNNQQAVAAMLLHHHRLASNHSRESKCPIAHDHTGLTQGEELNPLNNMPYLTQAAAPAQKTKLSTERTVSSIPRAPTSAGKGDSPYGAPAQCPIPHDKRDAPPSQASACPVQHDSGESQPGNWEYPSPQQFYNALVRKGWETPEESVDMMVLIHNFLNERAWQEVIEWEKLAGSDVSTLQLTRFQGRPGTLSPRARLFGWLGWAMPDRFNTEPPFDRHDWIVRRAPTADKPEGEEVRYVIDYYSTPDDPETDEASFHLDVRPALDSFSALRTRWKKTLEEYESGELFAMFRNPAEEAAAHGPSDGGAADAK
ncbi:CYC3 [Malassezia furfur]|nr:CYC3 [Malassezia furfur]